MKTGQSSLNKAVAPLPAGVKELAEELALEEAEVKLAKAEVKADSEAMDVDAPASTSQIACAGY